MHKDRHKISPASKAMQMLYPMNNTNEAILNPK